MLHLPDQPLEPGKVSPKPFAEGGGPAQQKKPRPDLDSITDEELLKVRICDLPIRMEGTKIEEQVQEVYRELDAKGIPFHPVCYLADEWFSLEGDPVIGIPFYLAHPRLIRMERKMVLEAEGDTHSWFLRLLRHETGHAVSHAYDLHKCRGYSRVFGRHKTYGETSRPRQYSRRYVQHLEDWYAQGHPDDDFAETFAVWLTPQMDWKKRYEGWPALEKLLFVDRMMADIRGKPPLKHTAEKSYRLTVLRFTLETYYKRRRKTLEEDFPEFFDSDLNRIFATGDETTSVHMASKFLRRNRSMLVRCISRWTAEKRYTVRKLIMRFTERCRQLRLRVHRSEAETMAEVVSCLTSMASNYFLTGKFKRQK